MDYPPNSKTAPTHREKKKIERVTSAEAVRRKKPLGRQFRDTFIAGDARGAVHYVFFGVLLPAAKDALVDAASQGIERLIFGESRKRRSSPPSGATGYVSYNYMGNRGDKPPMPNTLSKRARARHDFDEIVLPTRADAEEVLDRLFDLVSQYNSATVADLYELTGLSSSHIDHRWGWTNLSGASVARVRSGGYLLDLPEPEPLD